jgi:hypothetical protein
MVRLTRWLLPALAIAIASPAFSGGMQDRLNALSQTERTAKLGAAVRSADYSCEQPLRSRSKGRGAGRLLYVVNCEKGYSYLVSIRDDDIGAIKVMDCELAETVGASCQ